MNRRLLFTLAWVCVSGTTLAHAQSAAPGAPTASASAPAPAPVAPAAVATPTAARASSKSAKAGTTRPASAKATKPSAAKRATGESAETPAPGAGPRRLDNINIEGEIAIPQVLFVTAQEQRRFMDFQHRHYLKTSREVAADSTFPTKIAVIRSQPKDAKKEPTP